VASNNEKEIIMTALIFQKETYVPIGHKQDK